MSRKTTNPLKQESFLVTEPGTPAKPYVVRQDRMLFTPGQCWLNFDGQKVEALNMSPFGCAVLVPADQSAKLKEKFVAAGKWQCQVVFSSTEVQSIQLKFVAEETELHSSGKGFLWAFEAIGETFKIDILRALGLSGEAIQAQQDYAQIMAQIPSPLKQMVFEFKDWLHVLKNRVDELEKNAPIGNVQETEAYRTTIVRNVLDYLLKVMPLSYTLLPGLIQNLTPEQLEVATKFIREQLGPYLHGAPLAARAYQKPRGYAGDYEMMNFVYRNEFVGRSYFDQCIHKFQIEEASGTAVKNRALYLLEKLKHTVGAHTAQEKLKIISVASGSAMEQQLFLKEGQPYFGRPVKFICLDQDEEALKHANRQIRTIDLKSPSGFEFHFEHLAIKNVIEKGLPEQDYDLIYSAGLFDYLTDLPAQMAARRMLASLKKGGKLIIGNFSTSNPNIPYLDLILDWHLIYRSAEDLERMYKGLGSKVYVEKEPTGVNLFVVIEK